MSEVICSIFEVEDSSAGSVAEVLEDKEEFWGRGKKKEDDGDFEDMGMDWWRCIFYGF